VATSCTLRAARSSEPPVPVSVREPDLANGSDREPDNGAEQRRRHGACRVPCRDRDHQSARDRDAQSHRETFVHRCLVHACSTLSRAASPTFVDRAISSVQPCGLEGLLPTVWLAFPRFRAPFVDQAPCGVSSDARDDAESDAGRGA